MRKRKNIINRFDASEMRIYDLTVLPDNPDSSYPFKNRNNDKRVIQKINRNFKQVPFTRILKFRKEDLMELGENVYLMCTARMALKTKKDLFLRVGFVSDTEKKDIDDLVRYQIFEREKILSVNRIIQIKKP